MHTKFNPLYNRIQELRQKIEDMDVQLRRCQRIQLFPIADKEQEKATFEKKIQRISASEKEIIQKKERIAKLVGQVQGQIRSLLNPVVWFNPNQVNLRKYYKRLLVQQQDLNEKHQKITLEKESYKDEMFKINRSISIYYQYNTDDFRQKVTALKERRKKMRSFYDKLNQRSKEVGKRIAGLLKELDNIKDKHTEAGKKLEYASQLEERLGRCENGYDRRKVHEECASFFGHGKPKKAQAQAGKELESLNRNIAKLETRIHEIADRVARDIETIIIDGNNLCYSDGEFIGLKAIKSVLPSLKEKAEIHLIFDPQILSLTKLSSQNLRKSFGNNINTHICAPQTSADQTILGMSDAKKTTFVLSNDRFADFPDSQTVVSNRMIRHEITANTIMIHDLDIQTPFR